MIKKIKMAILLYSILGLFMFTKDANVAKAAVSDSNVISTNWAGVSKIYITLGSQDNALVKYFEWNGYRGWLSKSHREWHPKGSFTIYRGYLYSRSVKNIPMPTKKKALEEK